MEDWYKERKAGEKAITFLKQQIETWEIEIDYPAIVTEAQLDSIEHDNQLLYNEIDKIIIAVAFGQFKIAGKCDKQMLGVVATAFFRQRYIAKRAKERVLDPWDYADEYLEQIDVMERDFAAMTNKKAR